MKDKLHRHAGLIGVAGALALLLPVIGVIMDRKETIDDWFVVDALSVPDHSFAADPIIEFERTIFKPLSGQWSVETQKQLGHRWMTVCRGTGLSHYSPDESLPINGVSLGWFRDKCDKSPGTFRLQVVWQFTDPVTGDTKTRIVETEPFIVLE